MAEHREHVLFFAPDSEGQRVAAPSAIGERIYAWRALAPETRLGGVNAGVDAGGAELAACETLASSDDDDGGVLP